MMRSGSDDRSQGGRRGRAGKGGSNRKPTRKWTGQTGAEEQQEHRSHAEAPTTAARPQRDASARWAPRPAPYDHESRRPTRPVRRQPLPDRPGELSRNYGPDGYPVERTGGTGPYRFYDDPPDEQEGHELVRPEGSTPRLPRKLTVTRVAALRSQQLTRQAVNAFHRATTADGADRSGLTALTYSVMLNYASDAAMAVALANVLFFSPTDADASKGKIALYLLITVAPFALIAPLIGPLLDRIQRGRRMALCLTSAVQALMCIVMAVNFDAWLLYPAALGKMVLSKSFTVLKAAVTPRVLPPEITLSKTNARLTVFGLIAGGVFGGIGAGIGAIFGSPGTLWFAGIICVLGALQALRIPSWVEVTEGEVPASISARDEGARGGRTRRQPMGRHVVVSLWGNGTIKVLSGFLMTFAAFAVRATTEGDPLQQLLLLGLIAGAAGAGSFIGNAIGAQAHVGKPDHLIIGCVSGALFGAVTATLVPGIWTAALVALVGAITSAMAKNSLDAVIQNDMPEESRASAFGRSETVLQLGWVLGGACGLLLPPTYWIGFLVMSVLLALGLTQTLLSRRGASLIPGLGGDRPVRPDRRGWRADGERGAHPGWQASRATEGSSS